METVDSLYAEICEVLREAYSKPLSLKNPKTGAAEKVTLENYFPVHGEIKIIAQRGMMHQLRIRLYRSKKKIGGRRSSWEAFKELMMTSSKNPVEIFIIPKEKLLGGDVGEIYVFEDFLKDEESMKKAASIIAGMYFFYILWDLRKDNALELLADKKRDEKKIFAKLENKIFGERELDHGVFTAEEMLGISLYVLEHLGLHKDVHKLDTTVELHKDLASENGIAALQGLGLKISQ